MEEAEPAETDAAGEVVEGLTVARFGRQVVAGGEEMTGVQTDADAGGAARELDDPRQMLESPAERGALAGGVFEQHPRPVRRAVREKRRHRFGNAVEACGLGSRPGVQHHAEEAESQVAREAVWQWYQTVAYPRRRPPGAIILIMTRWHEDDLAGRLLKAEKEGGEKWTVLRLPALAEEHDPLGRTPGTALWPERYDLDWLAATRETIGPRAWASLYQQSPRPQEGNLFDRRWFELIDALPPNLTYCRFWDFATGTATGSDPDYHAGCLMGRDAEGRSYIADMKRNRYSPADLEALMRLAALSDKEQAKDGVLYIRAEKEKGAAGEQLCDHISRHVLAGYAFEGVPVTGSKEVRAMPLAAQAEAGHVKVLRGPWNGAFFDELESFPNGAHADQVDSVSGAYLCLAMKGAGQYRTIAGPGMTQ